MTTERALRRAFTGMVAASLAVSPDVEAGTATCDRCGAVLAVGDRVTATACCYENYTWELLGLACGSHPVPSVADDLGVAAMDQAVIGAVLERAGYRSPDGAFYPDAPTLGEVEVIEFSPAAAGYE